MQSARSRELLAVALCLALAGIGRYNYGNYLHHGARAEIYEMNRSLLESPPIPAERISDQSAIRIRDDDQPFSGFMESENYS